MCDHRDRLDPWLDDSHGCTPPFTAPHGIFGTRRVRQSLLNCRVQFTKASRSVGFATDMSPAVHAHVTFRRSLARRRSPDRLGPIHPCGREPTIPSIPSGRRRGAGNLLRRLDPQCHDHAERRDPCAGARPFGAQSWTLICVLSAVRLSVPGDEGVAAATVRLPTGDWPATPAAVSLTLRTRHVRLQAPRCERVQLPRRLHFHEDSDPGSGWPTTWRLARAERLGTPPGHAELRDDEFGSPRAGGGCWACGS